MAKRLLKRTTEAPKPAPPREPEPETSVGKEPVNVAGKTEPTLGMCKHCKTHAAHNAVSLLCYNCGKEAAGFTFNGKEFVKQ